ncbi:MAG: hypothetical protein ACI9J3_002863 [Parvicellaceae bacterium]|jgi:hypothetical protein
MKKYLVIILSILISNFVFGAKLLIPMDAGSQNNHIKAYGIAYWVLQNDIEVEWLLNYRGGSFLIDYYKTIEEELIIRGVSFEKIADVQAQQIKAKISDPEVNQEVVALQKAPKIAVYSPDGKQPWDDAVTLVLTYAEIPYETVYDSAVVAGSLPEYDWLHLHHEDFTGQYGKFYRSYRNAPWYKKQQSSAESMATKLGFGKVSEMKRSVALSIRNYTAGGGFLFTMCSGTDSYDIALAAQHTDICDYMFDGDAPDPNAQNELKYDETFAFKDFRLKMNPMEYEFSDIDGTKAHVVPEQNDKFTLFDFSAKWDIVPTMLCQNHTTIVDGFMGQTTDFYKKYIKSNVLVMGENKSIGTAKYIHGEFGKGQWTFYGGHDPEDWRHYVGDPPTDLDLFPNSAGYRLILNNILFPAAKKQPQKT